MTSTTLTSAVGQQIDRAEEHRAAGEAVRGVQQVGGDRESCGSSDSSPWVSSTGDLPDAHRGSPSRSRTSADELGCAVETLDDDADLEDPVQRSPAV